MDMQELELLMPPTSLSRVQEGLNKANVMVEKYESRVRPFIPIGYENSTSQELYEHLKSISTAKEAKLARVSG